MCAISHNSHQRYGSSCKKFVVTRPIMMKNTQQRQENNEHRLATQNSILGNLSSLTWSSCSSSGSFACSHLFLQVPICHFITRVIARLRVPRYPLTALHQTSFGQISKTRLY